MFNIGPEKLFLLFVIALVVLGPSKLPQAARTVGKWVAEIRRVTGGFQDEVRSALAEPRDALTSAVGDLRGELDGFRKDMGGTFGSAGWRPDNGAGAGPGPAAEGPAWSTPANGSPATAGARGGAVHEPSTPLPPAPDDPSLN